MSSMTHNFRALRAELLCQGVTITELGQQECHAIDHQWLDTYAGLVKQKHGVLVYHGFRWHGFSHHLQPCLEGQPALDKYLSQWAAPFYVFDESLGFCALCSAKAYPDLSNLREDVYVAHKNMKWTMAFTHESPHIGPFFAEKSDV